MTESNVQSFMWHGLFMKNASIQQAFNRSILQIA